MHSDIKAPKGSGPVICDNHKQFSPRKGPRLHKGKNAILDKQVPLTQVNWLGSNVTTGREKRCERGKQKGRNLQESGGGGQKNSSCYGDK